MKKIIRRGDILYLVAIGHDGREAHVTKATLAESIEPHLNPGSSGEDITTADIKMVDQSNGETLQEVFAWIKSNFDTHFNGISLVSAEVDELKSPVLHIGELSNNPKASELNAIFGNPTGNMKAYVQDVSGVHNTFLVTFLGGQWYYEKLSKSS